MKCTMPYNKVHFLSYHNGRGIMIFYDKTALLWEISNRQQFCVEFIVAYFNKKIHDFKKKIPFINFYNANIIISINIEWNFTKCVLKLSNNNN
jgi:hypothetical protein